MISTPTLVTAVAALSAVSSLAFSPSTFEYDARAVSGYESEHVHFPHVPSARFNHIDGTSPSVARRTFWEHDDFEERSIETSTPKPVRRFARDSGALEGAPLEARDVKVFLNNVGNQAKKLAEASSLYFLRSEGEDEGLGRRDFDDTEEMWAREPEFDYDMFERDDAASAALTPASPQEQAFSTEQLAQVPEQAPGSPLGSPEHELPGSPLGSPVSGSFSQTPGFSVPEPAASPEHAASEYVAAASEHTPAPEQQGATTPLVKTTVTTTKTPSNNAGNKTTTATAGASSASGTAVPVKGDLFTEFFGKLKHEANNVANAAKFFFRK